MSAARSDLDIHVAYHVYYKYMPNITLYVKDSDAVIVEKAKKKLGESLSAVFIDCVRNQLANLARTPTSRGMENVGTFDEYVQPMKDLLAEVNAANKLGLELHPAWRPIILDARSVNIGYKIHDAADPWRIMSLVVSPAYFERQPNGTTRLSASGKDRIGREFRTFWDGQKTDRHVYVEVI